MRIAPAGSAFDALAPLLSGPPQADPTSHLAEARAETWTPLPLGEPGPATFREIGEKLGVREQGWVTPSAPKLMLEP